MPCELIKINFKTGKVVSRRDLEAKEQYNPLQDPDFKFFTGELANLAKAAWEDGADPRRLVGFVTDETADTDMLIYDNSLVSDLDVLNSLKRLVVKVEANLSAPEAP